MVLPANIMCGIFGIVYGDHRKELGTILVEAGKRLIYRGYDSVGCAVINNGKIDLRKDVGSIEDVSKEYNFKEMEGIRGIVQLRWQPSAALQKGMHSPI